MKQQIENEDSVESFKIFCQHVNACNVNLIKKCTIIKIFTTFFNVNNKIIESFKIFIMC